MNAAILSAQQSQPPRCTAPGLLEVKVTAIENLATDICSFEFSLADGQRLPPFTAGAHVDIHLPGGGVRQYSLCNDPADERRYVVAVLKNPNGRGGSVAMHTQLQEGCTVRISNPRNHFPLSVDAHHHVLVAGGIGITPMMSMVAQLQARGESFRLHYCTRSVGRTAFLDTLIPLVDAGLATIYHDDGQGCKLDLTTAFRHFNDSDHLYYCGPNGFMNAVQQATKHWPKGHIHFERFGEPDRDEAQVKPVSQEAFVVELARSGTAFVVRPNESIVDVLNRHGVNVDVSCREGYCGTCMTRYVSGTPEHHDTVLDDDDRKRYVMVCCARASSEKLVLDL